MDRRACSRCGEWKPLTKEFFNTDRTRLYGLSYDCKKCHVLLNAAYYSRNRDWVNQQGKARYAQDRNRQLAVRRAYHLAHLREAALRGKKWRKKYPHKYAAHLAVKSALESGKLTKLDSCSACSVVGVRIHGHHEDYSKQLEVMWLCDPCHKQRHKERGE